MTTPNIPAAAVPPGRKWPRHDRSVLLLLALPGMFAVAGCSGEPLAAGADGQPAFRVRADFGAPLNADQGWAGALNENVTIHADQPFRLRFEVERPAPAPGSGRFRLQYRRNQVEWTGVGAYDFPHPLRELELDFAPVAFGATPEGWSIVQGNTTGLAVAAEGEARVLRARADSEPLLGLYSPPWDAIECAAEFRLPAGNRNGFALVFAYADAENHGRVFFDPVAGAIRVSRLVAGRETVITERPARIAPGQWLEVELQTENAAIEVKFEDDTVEFTADFGAAIPASPLGFHLSAGGAVDFRTFAVAGEPQTPRVSIVSCPAYANGAATADLLPGSSAPFQAGAGLNLAERTPSWGAAGGHGEFEWPLVVRRFADGAVTNEEGDSFEFRMVEEDGAVRGSPRNPVLRLAIPPGHLGGTFVETPGRIGPWRAGNGDLYFIMEPAETDNLFMMVKSADEGRTWREVDGANRPRTGDLESVDGRQIGDTIHIIHQVTPTLRYHAFRTSDHQTQPDTWAVRDEVAARVRSVAQAASLVVRSDGSMVTFYVGATVHYNIRSPTGVWGADTVLDSEVPPRSAGPKAILGANDVVHLGYYGMDGTVWYRRLLPDGTLTARQQLAAGLGATRAEFGAVLPLVFIPETNTVVVIYRQADGKLWERRITNDAPPTPAVPVTDRAVVQQAVDSQQPEAGAVSDGGAVQVLFIDEASRSIFSTNDRGGWQPPTLRVGDIHGSWVRGNIYTRRDGARVYGFVYDAGSDGGAGMNRFGEIVLRGD